MSKSETLIKTSWGDPYTAYLTVKLTKAGATVREGSNIIGSWDHTYFIKPTNGKTVEELHAHIRDMAEAFTPTAMLEEWGALSYFIGEYGYDYRTNRYKVC